MKGKILAVLKNKGGASLLFVLAIMMLLMSIGTSALVAAAASSASGTTARVQSRMDIYADSVIKSFTANLQSDKETDLGRSLIKGIFEEGRKALPTGGELKKVAIPVEYKTTEPALAFGAVPDNTTFILSFAPITFVKVPEIAAIPAVLSDDDGDPLTPDVEVAPTLPRVPSVTTINDFIMTLSIELKLGDKEITRVVEYKCSGTVVTFETDEVAGVAVDEKKATPIYTTFGDWEMVNYGKIG